MRLTTLLLVIACAPAPHVSLTSSALTDVCRPLWSGDARPDDGASDRAAMQVAVDTCAEVRVPRGVWDFDRAGPGSYSAYAAVSIHRRGVTVACEPGAVLRLSGDQGGQAATLLAVEPGAENVRITGCTLELAAANTAEQTHAIATTGVCSGDGCRPIENLSIDHNTCRWPRTGLARIGDCVKLFGNTAQTEVRRVRVTDNDFQPCGRSCVTLQRGLRDVLVADNTMLCAGDQCIDGEATGGGWCYGVVVTGNTVTSTPEAQGNYAVALVSTEGAVVSRNKLDRGVALYRTRDVVLSDNVISGTAQTGDAWIRIENRCDGDVVSGNVVRRIGAAGPLVKIEPRSGVTCDGLVVSGNSLTQGTAHVAVMASSTPGLKVTGNLVTHLTPATSYASVYVLSALADAPVTGVTVSDNTVRGSVTYAVTLEGYPGRFGAGVSVRGNTAPDAAFGLRVKNVDYFTAPLTVSGNSTLPGSYSPALQVTPGI